MENKPFKSAMQNKFDYTDVPHLFLHCTNSKCLRADNCLRHEVMLHAAQGPSKITIVNPAKISENGENCLYFLQNSKTRYALGITHLLDNVPHTKAIKIKRALYDYLKKRIYYKILNKERLINVEEQEFIRRLFSANGIEEEPLFDEYVEQYEW